MEITFSIVGTAGRNDDKNRLSLLSFQAMCIAAEGLLEQFAESNYRVTHLVSGGAAWADHVAVHLFLEEKVPNLRLYLPCAFEKCSFYNNNQPNAMLNPGKTLNHYHEQFRRVTHINSLTQIQMAKMKGAELININKGFHARNYHVAQSDFILAMTFGNKREVKSGGTAHTISCYLDKIKKDRTFDKSFHYDLNCGKIFLGCIVPKEDSTVFKNLKTVSNLLNVPSSQIKSFNPSFP